MASVNKESVREEVARIKSEFDLLSVNKQINDETKALIQSMIMLINWNEYYIISCSPIKKLQVESEGTKLIYRLIRRKVNNPGLWT